MCTDKYVCWDYYPIKREWFTRLTCTCTESVVPGSIIQWTVAMVTGSWWWEKVRQIKVLSWNSDVGYMRTLYDLTCCSKQLQLQWWSISYATSTHPQCMISSYSLKQKPKTKIGCNHTTKRYLLKAKDYMYSLFMMSWSSSTYSGDRISGMLYIFKTKCNNHLPVHESCNTECPTLREYTFERKYSNKANMSVLL